MQEAEQRRQELVQMVRDLKDLLERREEDMEAASKVRTLQHASLTLARAWRHVPCQLHQPSTCLPSSRLYCINGELYLTHNVRA